MITGVRTVEAQSTRLLEAAVIAAAFREALSLLSQIIHNSQEAIGSCSL